MIEACVKYLQGRDVICSKHHYSSKLYIVVQAQDTLNKEIGLAAVIYEPGKVPPAACINAELWHIFRFMIITLFHVSGYGYITQSPLLYRKNVNQNDLQDS